MPPRNRCLANDNSLNHDFILPIVEPLNVCLPLKTMAWSLTSPIWVNVEGALFASAFCSEVLVIQTTKRSIQFVEQHESTYVGILDSLDPSLDLMSDFDVAGTLLCREFGHAGVGFIYSQRLVPKHRGRFFRHDLHRSVP